MTSITIEVEVTKNGIGLHVTPAIYTGEADPHYREAENHVISAVCAKLNDLFERIISEMAKQGAVDAAQIDGSGPLVDGFKARLRKKS